MGNFVYRWTDNLTGMMYIGVHKGTEDDGYVCSSKVMKVEYLKRPQDFIREILSLHETYVDAREEEIRLLTEVNAVDNSMYYNRHNGESSGFRAPTGRRQSEETRKKISEAAKGRIPWNLGKSPSEETRAKISISNEGKKHSKETRKKMSLIRKGKPRKPETIQKMVNTRKGYSHSEETKQKIAMRVRGRKASPEAIEKNRIAQLKRYEQNRQLYGKSR